MKQSASISVLSINAGPIRTLASDADPMTSAIEKRPCSGSVFIGSNGVENDQVADMRYHGGADQAVYLYSADDYDWWSAALGRELDAGLFGENLTLRGLAVDLSIGDRLICGKLVLEVTGPRVPCHKLGLVMNDQEFPQVFRRAERPGAYCRVLREGVVRPGDAVERVPNPNRSMSILAMFRLYYDKPSRLDDLEAALATPLASRLREKFQARMQQHSGTTAHQ